jgi:hypothetical protein
MSAVTPLGVGGAGGVGSPAKQPSPPTTPPAASVVPPRAIDFSLGVPLRPIEALYTHSTIYRGIHRSSKLPYCIKVAPYPTQAELNWYINEANGMTSIISSFQNDDVSYLVFVCVCLVLKSLKKVTPFALQVFDCFMYELSFSTI